MTAKNIKRVRLLKKHRLTRLVQSAALWRGIAAGFSPQRYLVCKCDPRGDLLDYLVREDSFFGAWQSVGGLLTEALNQFDPHGETQTEAETRDTKPTERARAHAG